MTKQELLELKTRADDLQNEIMQLVNEFQGVGMAQITKKLMPVLMGGGLSPEKLGLPTDIMAKLEEFVNINKVCREAMAHLLGGE